jgi:uncharacterized protein
MIVRSFKTGGQPHRTWLEAKRTPEPWAFLVPANTPVEEATGHRWTSGYPVVLQFWPERFYQVCLLLKATGTEYYCNIMSPPVFDEVSDTVSFVDLELDVVVTSGGIALLDEEEFRAVRPAMAEDWAIHAETASQHLIQLAQVKAGPFSPATTKHWLQWLESL